METGTSPCPRAAPACRGWVPACTSLPVRSPGLPALPGNLQQSTGMVIQSRKRPCAGLFYFSAVKRLELTGIQPWPGVGQCGGCAALGGMAGRGWGRRGPWPGPIRAMLVPSFQQCGGSGAGTGTGWQALLAAAPLCSPTGVRWQQGEEQPRNSSSWCSPSRPGLGCAWKRQMRRSVQDGCSRPEGWGPLACPHPGHPSVPSRLDPLQRRDLRGAPGLLGPRRWQAGGRTLPRRGGTHARPQSRRQHFWPGGHSLSCRHRRRHSAAWSPSATGGQSPGRAGTPRERGVRVSPPAGRAHLRAGGAALPAGGEPLAQLLPHGDSSWVSVLPLPPRRVAAKGCPEKGWVQPRGCQPWPGGLSLGQGREGTRGVSAPQGAGGFTLGGRFADVAAAGSAALGGAGAIAVGVTELQAGSQGAPQHHGACAGLGCGTAGPW